MIGCGVGKHHNTNKGILKNRTVRINIPSADMLEKTDYCGLVSGKDTDKSGMLDIFCGGPGRPASMIREYPPLPGYRLVNTVECPTNKFSTSETVASNTKEIYLTNGHPDSKKMNLLLLTMPDNRYTGVSVSTWVMPGRQGKTLNNDIISFRL